METNKNTVKSYTERFKEMEDQIMLLTTQYFQAAQAFEASATIIQDLSIQIRMMNDQLQAMYDLGVVSRTTVADQINKKRTERIRDLLAKDEKAGIIEKIESVSSGSDIVVYSSEEAALAFKAVENFKDEGLDLELIGKKVGASLKGKIGEMEVNVKIDGIYKLKQVTNEKQG